MSENFLAQKTVAVTGGASGMGRAISLALAGAGASVSIGSLVAGNGTSVGAVVHLPPEETLEITRKEIEALGVDTACFHLDVTQSESVEQFLKGTEEKLGPIDILVNAAGITAEQTISGHSQELWDRVIDVNLNGTYRTIRYCLPGMMARKWGRIINIASTAAQVGAVTSGAYCASKAGVVGLTRCVALEGAPHGVTCNSISPTWVDTDFGKTWMESTDSAREEVQADNPQGRLIHPTEVGALALYLCREEAFGMTMQDLTLSAGSLW